MSSTGKENIPEYFALALHVQTMATFLPNFSTIPKNCTSFAGEHVDCLVGKTVVLESAQGVMAASVCYYGSCPLKKESISFTRNHWELTLKPKLDAPLPDQLAS